MKVHQMTKDVVTKIQRTLAVALFISPLLAPYAFGFAPVRAQGALMEKTTISQPKESIIMLSKGETERIREEERLKREQERKPVDTIYSQVSAYNSMPNQTDGSPFLTAIGSLTRDGIVAANNLPIGSIIRFPDLYGDKEFRVEDRMNPRYHNNIDIWMKDYNDAIRFGRRNMRVEVMEYGCGRGCE